ncbi:MAG: hypothetical protein ACRDEA_02530 [Microcystaceae cyanobacterium]
MNESYPDLTHSKSEDTDKLIQSLQAQLEAAQLENQELAKRLTILEKQLVERSQELRQQLIEAELPTLPEPAKPEAKVRLGTGMAVNRRKLLWLLPILPALWAIDAGVATYQRRMAEAKKQTLQQLDRAAHGYLYIDVQNVEYEPDGKSYRLTMLLQNLDPANPLYILLSPIRAFVQEGFLWKEVPARFPDTEGARMVKLTAQTLFQAIFEPNVEQPTELIPGYMHVRLDTDMSISQRGEPENDIIERSDPYYIYLKPHNADDEAILRHSQYPGSPPVYIPMPPH